MKILLVTGRSNGAEGVERFKTRPVGTKNCGSSIDSHFFLLFVGYMQIYDAD